MGQALVAHFLHTRNDRFTAGTDQGPEKQDLPFRVLPQKSGTASQPFRVKAIEFHIVFKNDDIFRTGFPSVSMKVRHFPPWNLEYIRGGGKEIKRWRRMD